VNQAQRDGETQEREERFLTVEDEGVETDLVPEITEELAVEKAEDDGEQGASKADLGYRSQGRVGLRPESQDERYRSEDRPVTDVTEHDAKEHREEDSDEGRGIDRPVLWQRHHPRDGFERTKQTGIVEDDRSAEIGGAQHLFALRNDAQQRQGLVNFTMSHLKEI